MTDDHKEIWLEPKSPLYAPEGRLWCQDPVWEDGVRYIRADLVPEIYRIHKGHEWAHIFLDEKTGTFAAVSSFGNFAHIWTHRGGETLKEFLLDLEYDYFMGKTAPDGGRVFSPEKTIKGIKQIILDRRRQGSKVLDQWTARDAWNSLHDLEDIDEVNHFFEELTSCRHIMHALDNDYYDLARDTDHPQCRGFWEKIWPEFLAQIRPKTTD